MLVEKISAHGFIRIHLEKFSAHGFIRGKLKIKRPFDNLLDVPKHNPDMCGIDNPVIQCGAEAEHAARYDLVADDHWFGNNIAHVEHHAHIGGGEKGRVAHIQPDTSQIGKYEGAELVRR